MNYRLSTMNFKTAEQIRHEYQNTDIKQCALAEKYNTSQRTISMIVNNKSFMPKEIRPNPRVLYKMQLQKVILWVTPEDLPTVMSYDKTRIKP